MRLARFRHPSTADDLHGDVQGSVVVAFADGSTVLSRLASGDRSAATGASYALDEVELLMPHEPGALYGIGRNYAAHAAELGNAVPTVPVVFVMPPSSATGPSGPVRRPAVTSRLDYEVELAVVIGRMPDGTLGPAGFCVADDVSARDLQDAEEQWARAKGADTFCPFGPWITTADELPGGPAAGSAGTAGAVLGTTAAGTAAAGTTAAGEAAGRTAGGTPILRLRSWVNDEPRQDATTADLIFDVPTLVAHIGAAITMRAGDLILTGTPHGVGKATPRPDGSGTGVYLQPGDVVRMEIEGLGAIEHSVV